MQPRQTVQFAALTALSMMGLLALWCSRPADLDSLAALSPPPSPLAASASIASGDGHAVAVTPPNERVEQPILPTLELTIVGSGDGRPLPDAAVDWQCTNSTARGQVTSNRDGATFLCPAPTGPCHLTVRCAGYVTLQAILPPVDAKACVALERGGDLTVTVRDGDGNPAPGVAIALLPRISGR